MVWPQATSGPLPCLGSLPSSTYPAPGRKYLLCAENTLIEIGENRLLLPQLEKCTCDGDTKSGVPSIFSRQHPLGAAMGGKDRNAGLHGKDGRERAATFVPTSGVLTPCTVTSVVLFECPTPIKINRPERHRQFGITKTASTLKVQGTTLRSSRQKQENGREMPGCDSGALSITHCTLPAHMCTRLWVFTVITRPCVHCGRGKIAQAHASRWKRKVCFWLSMPVSHSMVLSPLATYLPCSLPWRFTGSRGSRSFWIAGLPWNVEVQLHFFPLANNAHHIG